MTIESSDIVTHQPDSGSVIGQRYELMDPIARGGMGEVWLARDPVLDRMVAVKILHEDLMESPQFLERFRAEARHAGALTHPGIARVYDYGEGVRHGRPVAFLVMELIDGEPLSRVM